MKQTKYGDVVVKIIVVLIFVPLFANELHKHAAPFNCFWCVMYIFALFTNKIIGRAAASPPSRTTGPCAIIYSSVGLGNAPPYVISRTSRFAYAHNLRSHMFAPSFAFSEKVLLAFWESTWYTCNYILPARSKPLSAEERLERRRTLHRHQRSSHPGVLRKGKSACPGIVSLSTLC